MEDGFVKGYSDNLPYVDFEMVYEFMNSNKNTVQAEIKHGKTVRSTRGSYGDNAICYVQLKRENEICIVKGKITPEHKIYKKNYSIAVKIDETNQTVLECICCDCSASEGGCKHAVAFLFWLYRKSEEPSTTSKECYWKKSTLTAAVKDKKLSTLKDLVDKNIPKLKDYGGRYLEKVKTLEYDGGLFDFFKTLKYTELSMHHTILKFKDTGADKCADSFLEYLLNNATNEMCKEVEVATRQQSRSATWYQLRYARITASHLYEAAKCKKVDGVLVEKILGASKPFQSEAMQRGLTLERDVLKVVSQQKGLSINHSGLVLNTRYPIFGASPDGITDNFCIEIKCPSKEKTVKNYIENGIVKKTYYFQMQLQMLLTGKQNALFCIASPNFEENNQVDIHTVPFNEEECKEIMSAAECFWKTNIFPTLWY